LRRAGRLAVEAESALRCHSPGSGSAGRLPRHRRGAGSVGESSQQFSRVCGTGTPPPLMPLCFVPINGRAAGSLFATAAACAGSAWVWKLQKSYCRPCVLSIPPWGGADWFPAPSNLLLLFKFGNGIRIIQEIGPKVVSAGALVSCRLSFSRFDCDHTNGVSLERASHFHFLAGERLGPFLIA